MIRERAKVMKNNTICIPKSVREKLSLHESDIVIVRVRNQEAIIRKAPTWHDLLGVGEKTFKALGGGEKFLKKERAAWGK